MKTFKKIRIAGVICSSTSLAIAETDINKKQVRSTQSVPSIQATQSMPTLYGKVFITTTDNKGYLGDDKSQWQTDSNASRFGIKGKWQTDYRNINLIYKLEFEVNADDNDGFNVKGRNQYVGIETLYGTLLTGRHDSALKKSQGKVDLFNDYFSAYADIKYYMEGENRLTNVIGYKSPKFWELQYFTTVHSAEDASSSDSADTRIDSGHSHALMYKCKNKGLYFALAADNNIDKLDTTRVTAQYAVNNWKFGIIQQSSTLANSSSATNHSTMLNAAYKFNKLTFKTQLATTEETTNSRAFTSNESDTNGDAVKNPANKTNIVVVGVDFALSKQSTLLAYASHRQYEYDTSYTGTKDEDNLFGVGIKHSF